MIDLCWSFLVFKPNFDPLLVFEGGVLQYLCQFWILLFKKKLTSMVLGVNSIWGASTISPSRKRICEKNGKCNQYDFLQVLPKS